MIDQWTVNHGFSYMDVNTGVRDSVYVETSRAWITDHYIQKIKWNGVLQDTINWTSDSSDINIDYVSPNGRYTYNHAVWPADIWWEGTVSRNNDETSDPWHTLSFTPYDGWSYS